MEPTDINNGTDNKTLKNLARHDDDALLVPGIAGNISTFPHADPDAEMQALHDRIDDEDRDDEDREEKNEEVDEEETHKSDWGDVDPQHDSRSPRSPMDPSAPGSAV
ncbi:hypothetical protein [Flavobacterium pallidum]|uniref:Uncharacterized protein n=1 Tax=Flavobacterium pallidum TaxID=2172098 RepID=A0A2S1SE73_9FLAO|nr:hypothetical protein [Flavobacterium pallidum]AWI24686.1 hypothetical protein HYN49_01585 [Flavobacterium pallidum]